MNYYENDIYRKELEVIVESTPSIESLAGKTVVISGARGLIGSMLIDAVLFANRAKELDCKVYGIVRNIEKARERFSQYVDDENFELVKADINKDEIQIEDDIDYFIHGASNTHPIYYATRPIETIRTNTIGTDHTLEFAVRHNCKRYIFLSSVEIYGENRENKEKFTEDYCGYIDCNTLRAGYPEGKRLGESLCQAYRKEYGLDCVIARLARCYGAGLLEEDSKALTQFVKRAVAGEDVVLKSEGKQYYSYVYVADAVNALLILLFNGSDGGAYNVVGKNSDVTLKDLADMIANEVKRKVVFDLPDRIESEGYSKATRALLDGHKLMDLGWEAKYEMVDAVRRTIRILRSS